MMPYAGVRGFRNSSLFCLRERLRLVRLLCRGKARFQRRAGLILYVEGDVVLRGQAGNEPSRAQQHLEAGQRLRTGGGRAEVVLAPGLLLGLGESTELEMVQPHLSDLKVRLISGSAALHVVSNTYLDGALGSLRQRLG